MDFFALLGVLIGFAALTGGNYMEGGHIAALLDTPAGIIVIGGTLGAVVLQTPRDRLVRALGLLKWVVLPPRPDNSGYLRNLSTGANRRARKACWGSRRSWRGSGIRF